MVSYQIPMLLRRAPNLSVTPKTQFPQLFNFGVPLIAIILDRKATGIIHSDVATETMQDAAGFKCHETRI